MARRIFLSAAFVAAAVLPLGVISCSDDTNNGGAGGAGGSAGTGGTGGATSDGGTTDAKSDAPPSDSGGSGGSDRADTGPMLPDGSVPPSGTQLVKGNVTLEGVTSDNYAVYTDDTAGTLNVISLAGGMPTTIGSAGDRVAVRGPAVVSWVGTRVGTMQVWTAAHGVKPLAMTAVVSTALIAVSPDGERILYFDGADTGRTRANLFISGTDGTGQKQLADAVVLNDTSCTPALSFGGNAAAAAAFCTAPDMPDGGADDGGATDSGSADAGTGDAGTSDAGTSDAGTGDAGTGDAGTSDANPDAGPVPAATVQSYSGAGWNVANIATGVEPRVAVSPNGMMVLVSAPSGMLAYPIGGGTPTIIDPAGGIGIFTKDSSSVIYTAPGNLLKRSTVVSPSPTTLATSGFAALRATSPDEKWALGYTVVGSRQDVGDLYLASATTAGTPVTLSTDPAAGLFGSDGFTADSSHAIYYTDITSGGVGNFFSVATSGGAPVALGTNVWLHYAATGSKVTFDDNYDDSNNAADIRVVDTAQAGPPTLLVSLADADYFMAGSKDKVVYAWKYLAGPMAGLWVTPIP